VRLLMLKSRCRARLLRYWGLLDNNQNIINGGGKYTVFKMGLLFFVQNQQLEMAHLSRK